jgi:hypothetical protein
MFGNGRVDGRERLLGKFGRKLEEFLALRLSHGQLLVDKDCLQTRGSGSVRARARAAAASETIRRTRFPCSKI